MSACVLRGAHNVAIQTVAIGFGGFLENLGHHQVEVDTDADLKTVFLRTVRNLRYLSMLVRSVQTEKTFQ